ncbi:hypothetical protein ACWEHA_06590 [Amycolatopsis nivea]
MRGNARRRQLGIQRSAYTEEPHALAARAIPRQSQADSRARLGFDECTDAQRQFRAFLAIFLLNSPSVPQRFLLDDKAGSFVSSGVSRLLSKPVLISAQYNDLSILTVMGDHLLQCLADQEDSTHGIPGLRPVTVEGDGEALVLQHLPTGALLRFRYFDYFNPRQRTPPWFIPTHWDRMQRSPTIGTQERGMIEAAPPIHEDAKVLLAGLVARITCWSGGEGWAVSRLVHDDLADREQGKGGWTFSHLWGGDTDWVLRWGGFSAVPVADVARALTHEAIGIAGATARTIADDIVEVRLRNAKLRLELHRAAISDLFDWEPDGTRS